MVFSQGDQSQLFFFAQGSNLLDIFADSLLDQWQNWIVFVGHLFISDTEKGRLEHLLLDEFLIIGQSLLNSVDSVVDDVVDNGSLVGGFHLLGGLEESGSSVVDVDLQVDLFVGQELKN